MTTIADVFEELLFGAGFWIGFLFIFAICIVVSYRFKFSGVVCEVVLLFMAIETASELAVSSDRLWGVIMYLVGMILIGYRLVQDLMES